MRFPVRAIAGSVAAAFLISGCSTTAQDEGSAGADGDVQTDFGVTDDEIHLAVMTDTSGVFKASGLAYTAGNELWANDVNEAGGICGRQVVLDIQDHGYKPDNAVSQYATIAEDNLAIVQMIGSPILAALKQRVTNDNMLTLPAAWASANLDSEAVLMIGQTYDVEMINGLAYLQEKGAIQDGDKIGHIYIDSEYGQNALLGSEYYAEEHDLDLVGVPVQSTDVDMTATMTKLKAEGVKAILVTTAYAATGSVVLQNVGQGINVPILGSSPTFSTTLLQDPGVVTALEQFYAVYTNDVFGSGSGNELVATIEKEYAEAYTDPPDDSIPGGYVFGLALQAVLEQACSNGDMTRAGVLEARKQIPDIDTQGVTGNLDLSDPGAPTTREGFIMKVDPASAVGVVIEKELFASEEAKAYKTPYQK